MNLNNMSFTGVANDDRRIAAELQAMGAFDEVETPDSALSKAFEAIGSFMTWMRWKGEVGVYGCRVGATYARKMEATHLA